MIHWIKRSTAANNPNANISIPETLLSHHKDFSLNLDLNLDKSELRKNHQILEPAKTPKTIDEV